MTRSDYFRPVRGGISGLCEEADDNPLSNRRAGFPNRVTYYVVSSPDHTFSARSKEGLVSKVDFLGPETITLQDFVQ